MALTVWTHVWQGVALLALPLAVLVNPWLLARTVAPRVDTPLAAAIAAAGLFAINTAVPVALHLAAVPITPRALALTHAALALLLGATRYPATWISSPPSALESPPATRHPTPGALLLWTAMLLVVLVFPYTPLAGIDTYKWQDLASNVAVTRRVPWLIHPLSLVGFTPRSYPSAPSLALATIEIMGGLPIEGGFFVLSALTALSCLATAYALGRRVFGPAGDRPAAWFAVAMALAPAFMRYTHWATGRGVFAALLPLFILCLLSLNRWQAWLALPFIAVLLPLSHKAGMIALAALPPVFAAAWLLPRAAARPVLLALTVPSVLLGLAVTHPIAAPRPLGNLIGLVRYDLSRFTWMSPAAAIGVIFARDAWRTPAGRCLLAGLLAAWPLGHHSEPYAALIALPFTALAAVRGVEWLIARAPRLASCVPPVLAAITLAGALCVVIYRGAKATPRAVRAAALWLERQDPVGPFMVEASTDRHRIQGYLSGCPRFDVSTATNAALYALPRPPWRGLSDRAVTDWISYFRNIFGLTETGADWYGGARRVYTFATGGEAPPAPDAELIYDRRGVRIYRRMLKP